MKISVSKPEKSQPVECRQSLVVLDTEKYSEQKQYKIESGESILHFQPAFDLANDVLWDLNMMTKHLYLSPNAFKMFKISRPSVFDAQEFWNSIVYEKDKPRLINEFNPIISGQTDLFNLESRIKLDTDVIQWISVKGKVVSRATDGSLNRLIGTCTDNTSFKLKDEELKTKHKQFKSYFEHSPIGLAINTFNYSWIEINQELCLMLGFTKEELLDKSWTEVVHSDDIQPTLKLIEDAIEGRIDNFKINNRFVRKNGEILYATLSSVCVRNDDGSFHHFLTSIVNITERFKIEEKLKNERIILRTLVDSLPVTIYIIDKEGRKVISNQADLETIGSKNEADVLGKTDLELFPGEVGERGHTDNLFVINNKVPVKNRLENFFDKEGHQKWLLTNKIPFFDQYNQVSGLIGFGIDITDLRNLQQKIIDSEAYYRTLINISPDGIIVTDREGKLTFISKKIPEILGISDNENLIGEKIFNWIVPEDLDLATKNFNNILNGGKIPQPSEYRCFKFDKSKFWIELSSAPIFEASGVSSGLMILCRDISVRKKTEVDLISAKNKAEESDKLKTALLRNISHEIRTPLNGIVGFSELLRESFLTQAEMSSYIDAIQQSSYQLLSIINDLIDISSIEANIINKQKSNINLNELLRDIQNQFRFEASSKNLILELTEGATYDMANICTDKPKLKQTISSLLSNAIKFTESGQISFGYSYNSSFLEFYVSDTGIGIELKYHSKIFEPFFQIENELSKRFEGTGLGLSISKAFVNLLGGEIWLTSKINEGSTFYFTIPYENEESNLSNQ